MASWIKRGLVVPLALLGIIGLMLMGRTLLPPAGESGSPLEGSFALAATLDEVLERPDVYELPGVAVFAPAADEADAELLSLSTLLCDAITERLVATRQLRLVSCTSTRAAMQANLAGANLGHLLGVDYAVDGELSRDAGGHPRLHLQMRELKRVAQVWALEDDATPERVAHVVRRVSDRVLTGVGIETEVEVAPIPPLLYGQYLRATQLARGSTEQRFEALRLVQDVLAQAPDYSPALYSELALRSMTASFARPGEPPPEPEVLLQRNQERLEQTRLLGERLLQLDPEDWRGHTLLLNAAVEQGRWVTALQHGERLAQGPAGRPGGARIHAQLQLYAGYAARAKSQARLAAVADPLDAQAYRVLAQAHGILGEDDAMRSFAAIAREISGHGVPLIEAVLARRAGDTAGFVKHFTDWLTPLYGDAEAAQRVARGVVDEAARDQALVAIEALPPSGRVRAAGHFLEYALLGMPERAADAVREATERSTAGWLEQLRWPELADMRTQPAFGDAMLRAGLTQLWDREGGADGCARVPGAGWRCH